MNQSEFLAITCDLSWVKAQEKLNAQSVVGFAPAFQRLKNWQEIFKRIIKCINGYREITFVWNNYFHLKTAKRNIPLSA